jgi:hypothetical protein
MEKYFALSILAAIFVIGAASESADTLKSEPAANSCTPLQVITGNCVIAAADPVEINSGSNEASAPSESGSVTCTPTQVILGNCVIPASTAGNEPASPPPQEIPASISADTPVPSGSGSVTCTPSQVLLGNCVIPASGSGSVSCTASEVILGTCNISGGSAEVTSKPAEAAAVNPISEPVGSVNSAVNCTPLQVISGNCIRGKEIEPSEDQQKTEET